MIIKKLSLYSDYIAVYIFKCGLIGLSKVKIFNLYVSSVQFQLLISSFISHFFSFFLLVDIKEGENTHQLSVLDTAGQVSRGE